MVLNPGISAGHLGASNTCRAQGRWGGVRQGRADRAIGAMLAMFLTIPASNAKGWRMAGMGGVGWNGETGVIPDFGPRIWDGVTRLQPPGAWGVRPVGVAPGPGPSPLLTRGSPQWPHAGQGEPGQEQQQGPGTEPGPFRVPEPTAGQTGPRDWANK
jgi:hypothetical protein